MTILLLIQTVLSSASDKAKLFAQNFSKNSNLDDSGIYLMTQVSSRLHSWSYTFPTIH